MNRIASALLASALLLGPSLAASQPVKLGELNSYKVFTAFLDPYRKGMELALAEENAAGGVLGRPLEIVSRDDSGTPGDAVRVAEELVAREKVAMLMGTFLGGSAFALLVLALGLRSRRDSAPFTPFLLLGVLLSWVLRPGYLFS